MPAKNTVKIFVENGFYHIYNRGVDKRLIFKKTRDYKVFLNILKTSLSPPKKPQLLKKTFTLKGSTFKGVPRQPQNFSKEIKLLSYCLIPNHFHLLIQQKPKHAIKDFMRSLATRYSMYFNKTNKRTGSLFQSIYKAVLVENENQLLHLTRYIHQNPLDVWDKPLTEYPYSSYPEYLGTRNSSWIKPNLILSYFKSKRRTDDRDILSYESFIDGPDEDTSQKLKGLKID